jgi:glycosyltransferase involved in cell wall biosynthesis
MEQPITASIIVNNYNYAHYVKQAIDSALQQTYPGCEVIIVDDGSTDGSRDIINAYSDKAKLVLKKNGGQASAFNAGFAASTGDLIFFLDADDALAPDTVERIVTTWRGSQVAKVHWPLHVIDAEGKQASAITPPSPLPEGDLISQVAKLGPNAYLSPPTTGNAWSRHFLEAVMPMPESPYTISADNYLCMLAPLHGEVQAVHEPSGYYRLHGQNNFRSQVLEDAWLKSRVDRYAYSCKVLKKQLTRLDIRANVDTWNEQSWVMRLSQSIRDIRVHVPANTAFILADADEWQVGRHIANRNIIPFVEKDNRYWGMPADDDDAIREIERHSNAGYIFFAWPVFWFKDHYQKMFDYLSSRHFCVIDNDRLIGYKLLRDA